MRELYRERESIRADLVSVDRSESISGWPSGQNAALDGSATKNLPKTFLDQKKPKSSKKKMMTF